MTVEESAAQALTYVFEKPTVFSRSQLRFVSGLQGKPSYDSWFASRGGVANTETDIRLVLRGNRNETVQITNIGVDKVCTRPATGTIVYNPPAGEGDVIPIQFDMDAPNPQALTQVPGTGKLARYFDLHTLTLANDESETIFIAASAATHYCRFSLVIQLLDGDKHLTQFVRDGGRDFAVTGWYLLPSGELNTSRYTHVYYGGVASPDSDQLVKIK